MFMGMVAHTSRAAEAMPEYHLVLQSHRFDPTTLDVPANTKFKVLVTN
ncbi:cupredoxin domain-containing protein, partial [Streptococcus pyogenes]